ncbi:MAG TPA: TetR/AcrR family transcriptional regulator [Baekduia sp.]|nr:TetR/AcrR family transcriptional regulator [Baekduia sp.]
MTTEPSPAPAPGRQLPKGRHGLSREFIVRNQRERMLDAMANVVADKGYAATRVADVTEYAGVSRKTFYEQFTDKEDCFLAAFDAIAGLMMEKLARRLAEADDTWESKVHALLGEFLAFCAAEPAFARMCIVEVLSSGPRGLERRDQAMANFYPIIDQLPREELGSPSWLSPITPNYLVGGIYEVIYSAIRRGEVERLPELEGELTSLVFRAYLHPREWERGTGRKATTS